MVMPILQMNGIDKSYPGVHALDKVDFDLYGGEIHAIIGENGAGKSTFMKILDGSVLKDEGKIIIKGHEVNINNPHAAQQLGISMVYQELSLLPNLTVAENIFLGRWPRKKYSKAINWLELFKEAKKALSKLGLDDINVSEHIMNYGMSKRQMVEIAKALSADVKILLLDEPTSALSDEETEKLFSIIKKLRNKGVGIIYVSHRLAEIKQICDRVTILRNGKKIGTITRQEYDEKQLINMMIGKEVRERFPKQNHKKEKEVFKVKGLKVNGKLRNISFNLYCGEVLGIFGLMGSGRTELARAIFGADRIDGGEIFIDQKKLNISSTKEAIRAGIGYLTEDRHGGLILQMNVPQNITLASLKKFLKFGFINLEAEKNTAKNYIKELGIQVSSLNQKLGFLSGGNQQKVALGKLLCSNSKIMILDDPTRGIDVGAKIEVYQLMNEFSKAGSGIILISSEIPEVLNLSDRILVMNNGTISAEFKRREASEEILLKHAM